MTDKKEYAQEDIVSIEESIATISVKIAEVERNLEKLDKDMSDKIRLWLKTAPENEEDGKKREKVIMDLNKKEKELDERYEELRREKDELSRQLRIAYTAVIKNYHKTKDEEKKKGTAPKNTTVTDLKKSTILSGTSQSGIDEVNFARIFKDWELNKIEITEPSTKPSSKQSKKPKKKPPFAKQTYYGDIVEAEALGKVICIKKIVGDKLLPNAYEDISKAYKAMHEILGHSNLLTPIGVVSFKKFIVLELAQNQYHSLQDILERNIRITLQEKNANAEEREEKIKLGFTKKLHIAKCISLAMSWLHEQNEDYKHLRLKPSNILFTRDWKIKVTDYGLGLPHKYVVEKDLDNVLFENKHAHYSAPEIFLDHPTCAQASQRSDLWSFGMLLYSLLTEQFPYSDAKDFKEVSKLVSERVVPDLPRNTPDTLLALIQKCWQKTPDKRGTFKDISANDQWERISTEAQSAGQKDAQTIWDDAVKTLQGGNAKTQSIPWDHFSTVFWKFLGIDNSKDKKNYNTKCLQAMLGIPFNLQGKPPEVLKSNYFNFIKILGPLRTQGADAAAFIGNIVELCRNKWFYGVADRAKAEAAINLNLNASTSFAKFITKDPKKVKNPYLVRISANQGYVFCLSFLLDSSGKIEHTLIQPESYRDEGFISYLQKEVKKKSLNAFDSTSREYDDLFDEPFEILESTMTLIEGDGSSAANSLMGSMSMTGTKTLIK